MVDDLDEKRIDSLEKLAAKFVILLPFLNDFLGGGRHRKLVATEGRQPLSLALRRLDHHVVKSKNCFERVSKKLTVEKRFCEDACWQELGSG